MSRDLIRNDVDKIKSTALELKKLLHYGKDKQLELSMEKVRPVEFLVDDFSWFRMLVRDNSKKEALTKNFPPKMHKAVVETSKQGKTTVNKAVKLMETMDPLVQYSYTADDYASRLEGRCRGILAQYDSTYKEVIVHRMKTNMDQVEAKTANCLSLLEKSIKAAEEDIAAWKQQRKFEDDRVVQEDVKAKNSIAQDIIRKENDELKLIESHCKEDIKTINRKLGELNTELREVKAERNMMQEKLNNKLRNNHWEQDRLKETLAQLQEEVTQLQKKLEPLETEDRELTTKIERNKYFQEEANQEYEACKKQVKDMQNKIENLLEMTNASMQLMDDMTRWVNEVVKTISEKNKKVLQDLKQKEIHSNLQFRDALMAKIIFHNIQIEEVTHNLQDTRKETGELNKELKSAAKLGSKLKVTRIKESIRSLQGEENSFEKKKECYEREIKILQEKCEEVDKKIYASGIITQLPTIDERVAKWKAEQEKCFDDPNTGQFRSNISQF